MQTDIIYWAPDLLDVYYRGMGLQKGDSRDLSNGHWRFIVANFGVPSESIFDAKPPKKEILKVRTPHLFQECVC